MSDFKAEYLPREIIIDIDDDLASAAQMELETRAEADVNGCYGYFPGASHVGVDHNLPHSSALAAELPSIEVFGLELGFSFLRAATRPIGALAQYHLDGDGSSGLRQKGYSEDKLAWRLLLNLHPVKTRTFLYLDYDPSKLLLQQAPGYKQMVGTYPAEAAEVMSLRPRSRKQASAILFCANRVLHRGSDDGTIGSDIGHFVGSYGVEIHE